MDRVFAPWRIDWVKREEERSGCPFCRLPRGDDDRENLVVARAESAYVLLNNAPYSPGHAMVIPYRHTGSYRALETATVTDHARLLQRTIEAIETAFEPQSFNTGMNLGGGAAGGSIDDHLHTHVVPRWEGDTNFMPVLGDTQVIVQALSESYDRLHEAFADQDGTEVSSAERAVRIE